MSRFITSATVEVEVDIRSDDLDDDTLREICEDRGLLPTIDIEDDIAEMYYAFRLGRDDRAIELAKKIAQDRTGRIL